jgi:hypothetical protein
MATQPPFFMKIAMSDLENSHERPFFMKIAMSDLENSHERPFSIILEAKTYRFLTKKWSPPEIQECDLWQGNICGVRCMSLWSTINGHRTPILPKIAMNDHFQ